MQTIKPLWKKKSYLTQRIFLNLKKNSFFKMQPKVLVGCPTHKVKEYCLKDYSKIVKSLTYSNYDVLLVDNTKGNSYYKKIKEENIPVVKGPYYEGAMDRIVASRNILREEVLKGNYDYFLSLEQDVVPPKNIIESLLKHNKKVISAVYFNFRIANNERKPMPMLCFKPKNEKKDIMYYLPEEYIFQKPALYKIFASGLGCLLIHRDVLEKIKFRHGDEGFDDVWFSKDCRENNIDIFADTSLKCDHITLKGGKWSNIKK